MQFWQYAAGLFLIAFAPLLGILLAKISSDERKPGEKWFVLLRYCILGFTSLMLLWLRRDSVWLASAIVVGTLLFVGRSYPLLHSALVGLAYWQATKTVLLLEISFGLILLGIVGGTLHAAPRSLRQRMFWTNQFSDFAIVIWPVLIALPLYFF